MSFKRTSAAFIAVSVALVFAANANAVIYDVIAITINSPTAPAIGEAQISLDVTDLSNDQVLFTYANSGPEASSITQIYLDTSQGSVLADLIQIQNTPGLVEFLPITTNKGNLPAGNTLTPPFVENLVLSAVSDKPAPTMGINPGESLGLVYGLVSGANFGDLIMQLNDQTIRIGMHVQSFEDGSSETFIVDEPRIPIPEPSCLSLLGFGGLCFLRPRRRAA